MKGFIKNETNRSIFKLQRSLPIDGKLSFDNAYLTLGGSSGKKKGIEFIKWLKVNHFPEEGWVFYKEEGVLFFSGKTKSPEIKIDLHPKKVAPGKGAGRKFVKTNTKVNAKEVTAGSIIEADLPQAKKMLASIHSRQTLKKALTLSNHFSNKEGHRRLIQRRLEEVY